MFASIVHGVEQSLHSMGMPLGPEMLGAKQSVSSGLAKIGTAEAKAAVSAGTLSNETRLAVQRAEEAAREISKNRSGYVPRCPKTGEHLPLPRSRHGVDLPSSDTPHTQLGWRISDDGLSYRQTREWGYNGKPIKTTDWTDHGYPFKHDNPHDHLYLKNSTGGTLKRDKPEPFKVTDEKKIMETK